jgi:hypothetical protein
MTNGFWYLVDILPDCAPPLGRHQGKPDLVLFSSLAQQRQAGRQILFSWALRSAGQGLSGFCGVSKPETGEMAAPRLSLTARSRQAEFDSMPLEMLVLAQQNRELVSAVKAYASDSTLPALMGAYSGGDKKGNNGQHP